MDPKILWAPGTMAKMLMGKLTSRLLTCTLFTKFVHISIYRQLTDIICRPVTASPAAQYLLDIS